MAQDDIIVASKQASKQASAKSVISHQVNIVVNKAQQSFRFK